MEQPNGVENVVKKPETDHQNSVNPGLDLSPKPDPKFEGGGASGEQQADINDGESNATWNKSRKSVRWSEELVTESSSNPSRTMNSSSIAGGGSNPYVVTWVSYVFQSDSMDNVRDVLGRWGKKVGEATKKAEDLAENTWQHLI